MTRRQSQFSVGLLAALLLAGPAGVAAEELGEETLNSGGEAVPGPAAASDAVAAEVDSRDADIFGADTGRDAEIFGAADKRDDEIFGADDRRDDEIFTSADRDDDIFGSAPPDQPPSREDEILGGGLLSSAELDRRLGQAGGRLDIGGLLYLRASYNGVDGTPAEDGPLSSPGLFDLYMDARPSDDLRVFARGRITHRFAASPGSPFSPPGDQTTVALDQLWLKFDVEKALFVTVGRQPIKWGAGRFWNPTDFLNLQPRDPLAVFDERLGVGLVKLHLPLEASGWNLYALANFEGAHALGDVGGAFRAEKLIGAGELSFSTAIRRDQPVRLGADASFPLWLFDLRAEVAVFQGDEVVEYGGLPDFGAGDAPLPERLAKARPTSREGEWIPQAVLGADIDLLYGDDDFITVGAEYFYNGAGVDDPRLYPLLFAAGSFRPLYAGQHYLGLYASAMGPGSWNDTTLLASVLGNLSDNSWLGRLDYRVRLLTYLDVNTWVGYHFGDPGEFRLSLKVPAVPGAGQLDEGEWSNLGVAPGFRDLLINGGSIQATAVEFGAGLSLRF